MKSFFPLLLFFCIGWLAAEQVSAAASFSVLDPQQYRAIVKSSREKITQILALKKAKHFSSADEQIAFLVKQVEDRPYFYSQAMGEGDWQTPYSENTKPVPLSRFGRGIRGEDYFQTGALHINQNPVYRLDGFNCQTLVQLIMGLADSNDLNQFDQNYFAIAYGAAGTNAIRYYNRNNFIDGDFNLVNQKNGRLEDITRDGPLAYYAKKMEVTLTRQQWFLKQQENLKTSLTPNPSPLAKTAPGEGKIVEVLNSKDGPKMVERYLKVYSNLDFLNFKTQNLELYYLPKNLLVLRDSQGVYYPNLELLDKIPTPALVEIVRDSKHWSYFGKKVKDIVGSELSISHLGLLYKQNFKAGELIYQKITCSLNESRQKTCFVKPIFCQKKDCQELMFAHATNIFPNHFYWYQNKNGEYACAANLPKGIKKYSFCNRVTSLPFYDYLTEKHFGSYWNLELPSILGVHIEKLKKNETTTKF